MIHAAAPDLGAAPAPTLLASATGEAARSVRPHRRRCHFIAGSPVITVYPIEHSPVLLLASTRIRKGSDSAVSGLLHLQRLGQLRGATVVPEAAQHHAVPTHILDTGELHADCKTHYSYCLKRAVNPLNAAHNPLNSQVVLLLTVFTIEAFIRLRLVRPMLRTKHIKTQMEEAAGGGREVGKLILGELAHCPRYMKVLKAFRSYHSTVAAGTMISMGCSVYSIMILIDSMCGI
ncbi:hypothetical protein EVAR_314_1 [Eumeta japonica]|uniref:DUF4149 domain-containing protein n=1 Tax=Eumeta variegata TaxID=151549 RepID=A0A4C1S9U1_EUMVA|nr:hypothetical protein EVAR_314_1 [Eumeta japonica]